MKKSLSVVLGAVILAGLFVGFSSFAADMKSADKPADVKGIKGCKMCDKGPMGGRMMGEMMDKKVVATSDGGVVVVMGNVMIKYDKDLNVVKEVEIKSASLAMPMEKMGPGCPMMKGKMMKGMEEPAAVPTKK
ncbi:MAG: hypothetical protein HQL22_06445 [Candidatus Omnitrophica bacterium]|nr:hypothetical protein [Candidatus Omnitrophota bacterium]